MLEQAGSIAEHHATTCPLAWLGSVVVTVVGVGYVAAVHKRSTKFHRPWQKIRVASFLSGATLVGVAVSPPVAQFASVDARGHMVQHLLLGMYAPLALVLGAPVTVLLGALPNGGRRVAARLLTSRALGGVGHPGVAAVLSTGSLFLLYLTPLHVQAMSHPWLHHLLNAHFLLAGYLFAWSIAGVDPAPGRPGMRTRVTVLLLTVAAHAYLAKLLYAHAIELPIAEMHPLGQIEAAAVLMYYGGDVAELCLSVAMFSQWYRGWSSSRLVTSRVESARGNLLVGPPLPVKVRARELIRKARKAAG